MTDLTPAQVLERRRDLPLNQDTEGFVDLFAPGGVIEIPFAGSDLPARLDGQQAIRDYSRRIAASALRIDDLDTVAVHHNDDPEVLIVELVTRATVTTTAVHLGLARLAEASGDRRGRLAQPGLGARQLVFGAVFP